MGNRAVNSAKLLLTVMEQPGWGEDVPRIAQGLLSLQSRGAWRTTTSNLLGSLALEKFARHYENDPVSGKIRDRKSVVWGKSVSVRVELGCRGIIKKKKQ